MEKYTKSEFDRFNSKWKFNNKCKEWKAFLDKDGYGIFYFRKKSRKAHRVSYYFEKGSIEKDMVIDHICKNRSCVNIEHLRIVTKRDNILNNSNSISAINKAKVKCKNGHPFDKKYGKQRYCSICENAKSKRLHKKWIKEANSILC